MTFFDDYAAAIRAYPEAEVTIELIDVEVPGAALNTNEVGAFRIQVTNQGPLIMDDVTLKVRGLAGTEVKQNGAAATFADEFTTVLGQVPRIEAGGGVEVTTGGQFRFEAPGSPRNLQDLVEVTLHGWNASEDNLLASNSRGSDAVRAAYSDRVRAA
jgi:hypothetical protein